MSDSYEIYSFIICFIVFALLTGTFALLFTYLIKSQIKLIKHGVEDEALTTEYYKTLKKKERSKALSVIDKVFSLVVAIIVFSFFVFSSCVGINGDNVVTGTVPALQVVRSASMSKKHEKNTYLAKNNLNDQIQTFDLILTHELPDEFDLKLYDIVVYEVDNTLVIHRIVGIEEPDAEHPDERHFLLQGDNVEVADRFPVRYEQMKAIYIGERVPFIGSFIMFVQSPAGYLVVALVIFTVLIMPFIDRKIEKEKRERLCAIGVITVDKKVENVPVVEPEKVEDKKTKFSKFNSSASQIPLSEKLELLDDSAKSRYNDLREYLQGIKDVRVITGKKFHTYKVKNSPIAKLTVKGKTVNVYLALNPEEYKGTKYKFIDESGVKAHQYYPMRFKVTSERKIKHIKELINKISN